MIMMELGLIQGVEELIMADKGNGKDLNTKILTGKSRNKLLGGKGT